MELTNLIRFAWENGRDYAHDCKSSAEDAADYINFLSEWEDDIKELSVRLENTDTGEKQCNLPVVSQQRELLNSFCKWQEENWDELQLFTCEQQVDMFLAI